MYISSQNPAPFHSVFRYCVKRGNIVIGIYCKKGGVIIAKNKISSLILLALVITVIAVVAKNAFTEDETFAALTKKEDGTEQLVYETKLVGLDQSETTLENYKDNVLVLNFWASWCTYCIHEVPELNNFYNKQPKNVEFLTINMTADEKNAQSAETFKEQYNVEFPIFLDETGFLQESFEIIAFPTTLIIDSSGVVRHRIQGEVTQDQLNEMIAKL